MKGLYSVKVLVRTCVLTYALTCLSSLVSFGQSETNNPVTYDSTISESANGEGPFTWNVRITRQQGDNSQRPAFFFIPGSGEVGTNTAYLTSYGPHYWLQNGWDGGVKLGNGTHYPILITIEQPGANMRPWHLKAVLETLLRILPIKRNSVHVAGLSQGSYEWGELIGFSAYSGDQSSMSEIKSWVNLEGVGPGDNFLGFDAPYPSVYGTWAQQYGGRFFGLEGTMDSRNIWQISQAMNSAAGGSAYFSYENIGGGAHCCWNSMLDPSVPNWTSVGNVTNPNVVPSYNPASTMGSYFYSATTGSNVFQWMLRQGDTSMVGTTTTVAPPSVSAGAVQPVISLPTSTTTLTGSVTPASGTTIMSNTWTATGGPAAPTIAAPTSLTTTVTGLTTPGTYTFTLTSQNNAGQTASAPVSVTVAATSSTQAPSVTFANPTITINLPQNSVNLLANCTTYGGTTLSTVHWNVISAPIAPGILNSNNGNTGVVGLIAGTYVFQAVATDNQGNTGSGQLTVVVNPATTVQPPTVAFANPTINVTLPQNSVNLQANCTTYGGTTLSGVHWNVISAPVAPGILNSNNGNTGCVGLIAGTYVFQAVATDNLGNTGSGQLTVVVNPATTVQPPTVAFANPTITITLPQNSVNLQANCTTYGGTTLSGVHWNVISAPIAPGILNSNNGNTGCVGLIAGTYVFQAVATDNLGNTGSGQLTVVVNPAATVSSNPPPVTSSGVSTFVAPGEYEVFFIDHNKHLYGVGTNIRTLGVGNAGVGGTTLPLAVPSNLTWQTAASGLHNGAAVDNNGNVWTWGDNSQGQAGNGTTSTTEVMTPMQITTDINGNTFTGVTSLVSFYTGNVANGWYAIKSDGSLWIWGQTLGGMQGDGTEGSTSVTRPMQVPVPGGRQVAQVSSGNMTIVLCTDGTVWTCGNEGGNPQDLGYAATGTNYRTLQQLTGLSGIVQVAGGGSFNYALKSDGTLYGWGYYGYYLGGASGGVNTPVATPTVLNSRLNLPHPIKTIVTDMVSTHVILTDGTLWGWGDNAQGNIGNGQELNYATTTYPYAWDWNPGDLLQQTPVQITNRNDFVGVFSNWSYVLFTYAETADGTLYSWGRNKGGVLGNGIVGCSSVAGAYPNSWDVAAATVVNPLSITSATVVPSPYCISHPTTAPCNQCAVTNQTATSLDTANTGLTRTATSSLSMDASAVATGQISVYPSVTTGVLNLRISSDTNGMVQVSIYDLTGRIVQAEQIDKQETYLEKSFDVSRLPQGMYMIQVLIGNKKRMVSKFIKQ